MRIAIVSWLWTGIAVLAGSEVALLLAVLGLFVFDPYPPESKKSDARRQVMKVGDVVRDKITGFTGVVTSRTEWLNGCVRFGVQSKELHEGKVVDAQHFDEVQLEEVQDAPKTSWLQRLTGGDRPAPVGLPNPKERGTNA